MSVIINEDRMLQRLCTYLYSLQAEAKHSPMQKLQLGRSSPSLIFAPNFVRVLIADNCPKVKNCSQVQCFILCLLSHAEVTVIQTPITNFSSVHINFVIVTEFQLGPDGML